MSEAGNLDVKNDGNDDIYKDIGDFHFDRELVKLEECNKAYSEEIKTLSDKVTLLTKRNTELEGVNDILATNISILLKTAKAEIQRKQLIIDELRKISEDTSGRLGFNVNNLGLCKICGTKIASDNVNVVEEGEIVRSKSEEDVRSQVGSHRNHKSKDRREHSGNRKKKKKSRERSRGRSSDKHSSRSHRSSRRSESRSRHSRSSRSRPRYRSPDERRYSHQSKRSREKTSHSSGYVHKSSSQKREYVPRGRDIPWRSEERSKSERRRVPDSCSKLNSPAPQTSTKNEKNSGSAGISRPASADENQSNAFKSDSNVIKIREEEKDGVTTGIKKKEKTDGVKKPNKNDYHDRKNDNCDGYNASTKDSQNNLFTRQSILADLYDETIFCSKFSDAPRPQSTQMVAEHDNGVDSSSDESWSLSFGKKPQVSNKPKTLYSRRMEMKMKQKLQEDKMGSEGKCSENNSENQDKKLEEKPVWAEEEKEEGEITFDNDEDEQAAEDIVRKEEVCEKNAEDAPIPDESSQESDKIFADKTCAEDAKYEKPENTETEKDCEPSFGENIIKKLLELQNLEETPGIKEFSPLKNNYKLSKISPLKSVQKQHILEYYNLKPAQQLNNIDPEILDFSLSVPETPGKNFSNPFGTLDSQEAIKDNEDDKLETLEKELCTNDLITSKETEVDKRSDSNSVEAAAECSKVDKDEKLASPKGKKLGRTRAKRKLRPSSVKEKQADSTQVPAKNKKNKDPVTYQIRTRSRTGNENVKSTGEVNDLGEKKGRSSNKNKSVSAKRKRGVVSSEEETNEEEEQQKLKKKANNGPEIEISEGNNEERVEEQVENDKDLNELKTEDVSKANDIAYFDVFQSVSEAADEVNMEEKNPLEELSLSNISDYRATSTSCSDTQNKLMCENESKLSTGNSGDSSTFKVLRSYFMHSANEESDVEAFSEGATSSSGEYSDSGASAFVDLL